VENSEVVHIEDVSVLDTWDRLKADPRAVLVDVRTRAEWAFVGVPDLSSLGKQVLLIEWQSGPDYRPYNAIAADFARSTAAALAERGATKTDEVFFICRVGVRSRMAAEAMAAAGYSRCRNVADGFEGPLGAERHGSQTGGWKYEGLAWSRG
jgi:rhodanese-related sulfurtransferase